jgi:5-methylcytosine-specific restriction protein A
MQKKPPGYFKKYNDRRYTAHKKDVIAKVAAYQKANPDKLRKWRRDMYYRSPEKRIFYARQHQLRKKLFGSHTLDEWNNLKDLYQHCCLACGRQEPFTDLHYLWLTEDHVIPLAQNGTNDISNIQPLCIRCNNIKNNQTIDYRFPGEFAA